MNIHPRPTSGVLPPEPTLDPEISQYRSPLAQRLSRFANRLNSEHGAATAEYAVATMAAVGFAGLLVVILRGDEVRGILTDLIRRALSVG